MHVVSQNPKRNPIQTNLTRAITNRSYAASFSVECTLKTDFSSYDTHLISYLNVFCIKEVIPVQFELDFKSHVCTWRHRGRLKKKRGKWALILTCENKHTRTLWMIGAAWGAGTKAKIKVDKRQNSIYLIPFSYIDVRHFIGIQSYKKCLLFESLMNPKKKKKNFQC